MLEWSAVFLTLARLAWETAKPAAEAVIGARTVDLVVDIKGRMAGRLPLPENQDLVRGIRTAHLGAIDKVARRYEKRLAQLPAHEVASADQIFAERLRAFLDQRLKLTTGSTIDAEVLDAESIRRVLDDMVHPSTTLEGFASAAQAAREAAEKQAIAEIEKDADAKAPLLFQDMFTGRDGAGWYETFDLFVNEQIKGNERFRSIFFAAELVDIKRVVLAAERRIGELVKGVERLDVKLDRVIQTTEATHTAVTALPTQVAEIVRSARTVLAWRIDAPRRRLAG